MKNMKNTVLALLACPLLAQAAGTVDLSSLDMGMGMVDARSITYSGNCGDQLKRTFWPTLGLIDIRSLIDGDFVVSATIDTHPHYSEPATCNASLMYVSGDSSSGFNLKGSGRCQTRSGLGGNATVTASLRKSADGRNLLGNIAMGFQDSSGNVFCTGTGNLYNPK